MKKVLIFFSVVLIGTFAYGWYRKSIRMKEVTLALKKVLQVFGLTVATNIERIYRLETRDFTSGGFENTFAPGMQVGNGQTVFPYGWHSLSDYWKENPSRAPIGVVELRASVQQNDPQSGQLVNWIKFPSVEAAMMTLGYLLSRGYPTQKWSSINPNYDSILATITASIVNDLHTHPNT